MIARLRRSRLAWFSFTVLLLSCLVVAQEARQAAPADPLSEDRLMADMHGISSHTLLDYVKEMASPKYKGRLTGTPEFDAIAKWTADLLAGWKIKPAGDNGWFYQKFPDPYTLVYPGASLSLDIKLPNGDVIKRPYVFEEEYYRVRPPIQARSRRRSSMWATAPPRLNSATTTTRAST